MVEPNPNAVEMFERRIRERDSKIAKIASQTSKEEFDAGFNDYIAEWIKKPALYVVQFVTMMMANKNVTDAELIAILDKYKTLLCSCKKMPSLIATAEMHDRKIIVDYLHSLSYFQVSASVHFDEYMNNSKYAIDMEKKKYENSSTYKKIINEFDCEFDDKI